MRLLRKLNCNSKRKHLKFYYGPGLVYCNYQVSVCKLSALLFALDYNQSGYKQNASGKIGISCADFTELGFIKQVAQHG